MKSMLDGEPMSGPGAYGVMGAFDDQTTQPIVHNSTQICHS